MAKTYSCVLVGVDVHTVEIETVLGSGFTGLNILGLASDTTRDMRERVRSALESIGIAIPARRVVVNIGPSDVLKMSRTALSQLDFAVAASIIRALLEDKDGKKNLFTPQQEFLAGELSLCGELKPVSNVLIFETILASQGNQNAVSICLPSTNESRSNGFEFFSNLQEWFDSRKSGKMKSAKTKADLFQKNETDNAETRIETAAHELSILMKNPRAAVSLLVALAGGHHLLLAGEPGIGKSFLLKKSPAFFMPLTEKEMIEVKLIHGSCDALNRPFRAPHHSCTSAALVGNSALKPGEMTLAHHGVLFLDELAEFPRQTIESLREPLDSGHVTLSRAKGSVLYPAQFQLMSTTNPCPCGYLFSRKIPCRCHPSEIRKYLQKISGPILDRFCLQTWLDPLGVEENDMFANEILNLNTHETRVEFVRHFFAVQRKQRETDLKKDMNGLAVHATNALSMRGQEKVFQIHQTFQSLFPHLIKHPEFFEHVTKYRMLGEMIRKKGFF